MKKERSSKKVVIILSVLGFLVAGAVTAGILMWGWYQRALEPVGDCPSAGCEQVEVVISGGDAASVIAEMLEAKGLIKDARAVKIYMKLTGEGGKIKAGKHSVNKGMSVKELIEALSGDPVQDVFRVTFLPGGKLSDAKKTLMGLGYAEAEIDEVFSGKIEHPVLAGKPKKADLEGYLYGETYEFYVGASVEDIVKRCLDELESVVERHGLLEKFKKQGLKNLFEGITLASIVQREVSGPDQKQVAQVFLSRLEIGMMLGSDVTYQYICDKLGIDRDYTVDNPYNTRVHTGLTPGPISAPGEGALIAVAEPAKGDYLFFLSGDDDKTYFARTEYEHNSNIANHCQKKCQII